MTLPSQSKRGRVNGVDLAYVAQGRGDPVVFVHGGLNDHRTWGAQLAPFAAQYRVVAYSRRYHWPNPGATTAAYRGLDHRDDLAALIEALALAPAHVVGASYGAFVALLLAAARPDLVRSLVLGEPPVPTLFGPEAVAAAGAQVEPARQAFARGDAAGAVRAFLDTVVGPGAFDRLPPPARAALLDNAPEFALEVRTAPADYFAPFGCEDARAIRAPALLVTGEQSPAFLHRMTDELARCLPGTERAAVPAASHAMQRDNPAAYNQAVLAFLAGQGGAGAAT